MTLQNMPSARGFALLLLLLLLLVVRVPALPSAAQGFALHYAVDCAAPCDGRTACPRTAGCKRTVLDDCGCCRVCAAARGEVCYRTVAGMDGVKCGPGLRCAFDSQEDDFGDEYGICKDCPFGTYGLGCRKTCQCMLDICDRETGRCLKFSFFEILEGKSGNRRKTSLQSENEQGSGYIDNALKQDFLKDKANSSSEEKRLNPR